MNPQELENTERESIWSEEGRRGNKEEQEFQISSQIQQEIQQDFHHLIKRCLIPIEAGGVMTKKL